MVWLVARWSQQIGIMALSTIEFGIRPSVEISGIKQAQDLNSITFESSKDLITDDFSNRLDFFQTFQLRI